MPFCMYIYVNSVQSFLISFGKKVDLIQYMTMMGGKLAKNTNLIGFGSSQDAYSSDSFGLGRLGRGRDVYGLCRAHRHAGCIGRVVLAWVLGGTHADRCAQL